MKLIIIFKKHEVFKSRIFKACFLINEEVMLMRLTWFFKTYNFAADLKEHGTYTRYQSMDFKYTHIRHVTQDVVQRTAGMRWW